jgi:hypothetical protein
MAVLFIPVTDRGFGVMGAKTGEVMGAKTGEVDSVAAADCIEDDRHGLERSILVEGTDDTDFGVDRGAVKNARYRAAQSGVEHDVGSVAEVPREAGPRTSIGGSTRIGVGASARRGGRTGERAGAGASITMAEEAEEAESASADITGRDDDGGDDGNGSGNDVGADGGESGGGRNRVVRSSTMESPYDREGRANIAITADSSTTPSQRCQQVDASRYRSSRAG